MLVVNVARHAAEGHEKTVEVAAALQRIRPEEFQKLHVHRDGPDEVGRNVAEKVVHGVPGREVDVEHLGILAVGEHEVFLVARERSGTPVGELLGREKTQHLLRRVSYGVKRTHDGTHGCTGDVIDRYIVVFQRFEKCNVGNPLGSAAAEHYPDALGAAGKSQRQAQHQQGQVCFHSLDVYSERERKRRRRLFLHIGILEAEEV